MCVCVCGGGSAGSSSSYFRNLCCPTNDISNQFKPETSVFEISTMSRQHDLAYWNFSPQPYICLSLYHVTQLTHWHKTAKADGNPPMSSAQVATGKSSLCWKRQWKIMLKYNMHPSHPVEHMTLHRELFYRFYLGWSSSPCWRKTWNNNTGKEKATATYTCMYIICMHGR